MPKKPALAKQPAHMALFIEYLERIESGEKGVTQIEYTKRAGCSQSAVSEAFRRCHKYLQSLDQEQRQILVDRANRNLAQAALIGTANRLKINMSAAENLNSDEKKDLALQSLSESITKDTLDRIPEISKKNAEVQILNINANKSVNLPNLLADNPTDVRENLGKMLHDDT